MWERQVQQNNRDRDRREFGRRACAIRGMAMGAGQPPLACTLRDLSEGGALVDFDVAAPANRSVRITIDGTELEALCEVRHVRGRQIGVRFVRPSDGYAICRHFQAAVVTPSDCAPVMVKCMPKLDVSELRRDVLERAKVIVASRLVGFRVPRLTRRGRCAGWAQATALAMLLNSATLTAAATRSAAEGCGAYEDWPQA